jgi:hypothetical protein
MADASAFDLVCAEIEKATSLNNLQARGTVRLALKSAGLDAASVTAAQLRVVLEKLMPAELKSRGCEDAEGVCARISGRLAGTSFSGSGDSPEAIFARLGRA